MLKKSIALLASSAFLVAGPGQLTATAVVHARAVTPANATLIPTIVTGLNSPAPVSFLASSALLVPTAFSVQPTNSWGVPAPVVQGPGAAVQAPLDVIQSANADFSKKDGALKTIFENSMRTDAEMAAAPPVRSERDNASPGQDDRLKEQAVDLTVRFIRNHPEVLGLDAIDPAKPFPARIKSARILRATGGDGGVYGFVVFHPQEYHGIPIESPGSSFLGEPQFVVQFDKALVFAPEYSWFRESEITAPTEAKVRENDVRRALVGQKLKYPGGVWGDATYTIKPEDIAQTGRLTILPLAIATNAWRFHLTWKFEVGTGLKFHVYVNAVTGKVIWSGRVKDKTLGQ